MIVRPESRVWGASPARNAVSLLIGLLLAVAGALLIVSPASANGSKPNGANGSVKIDGAPVDNGPANEPHVDCRFTVQFFGFDVGADSTWVTFKGWPPSGDKSVVAPTEGRSSFTFDGGRPPGSTINHTEWYSLDTSGLKPNKKGEVHVKLFVRVTDAGGKVLFKKFKVFWLKQCVESTPTPTPTTTPTVAPTETPSPTPTASTPPETGSTGSPTPSVSPTPGPTGFEGGLGGSIGSGSGASGSNGPLTPVGWVLLFGGIGVATLSAVRLAGSTSRSTTGA